ERLRLRSESRPIERRKEEITGAIAGEGAPRAVAAVGTGSEPDEQQACARIAECRNGFSPVSAVAMRTLALARHLRRVGAELRAARAPHDCGLDLVEVP